MMDIQKIKKLVEMIEASDIAEIEIQEGKDSVRISRNYNNTQVAMMPVPAQAAAAVAPPPVAAEAPPPAETKEAVITGHQVLSPMVGSFYRSPSPEKAMCVEEASVVKVTDVLCIIEAMKILNTIESDKAGVVKKILVENGQPVEYNQPLFIIE
jgi:acetyl-CoA carboxylase biotin carboxyl carrier protein